MFVDNWIEKWSSSCVDVKVRVRNFVHPVEITVIVYAGKLITHCLKVILKLETHFSTGASNDVCEVYLCPTANVIGSQSWKCISVQVLQTMYERYTDFLLQML